jgi:hypothetical protein
MIGSVPLADEASFVCTGAELEPNSTSLDCVLGLFGVLCAGAFPRGIVYVGDHSW